MRKTQMSDRITELTNRRPGGLTLVYKDRAEADAQPMLWGDVPKI